MDNRTKEEDRMDNHPHDSDPTLLQLVTRLARVTGCPEERVWDRMVKGVVCEAARMQHGRLALLHVTVDPRQGKVILEVRGHTRTVDATELNRMRHRRGRPTLGQLISTALDSQRKAHTPRIGTLVEATLIAGRAGLLQLDVDGLPAVMAAKDALAEDRFKPGDRLLALCTAVEVEADRVRLRLSRLHAGFLPRLVEAKVAAVAAGTVRVHRVLRLPGRVTKVFVVSEADGVRPVHACGGEGIRLPAVEAELPRGERVEVVAYTADPQPLVQRLYDAVTEVGVDIDRAAGTGVVVVADKDVPAVASLNPYAWMLADLLGLRHVEVRGVVEWLGKLLAQAPSPRQGPGRADVPQRAGGPGQAPRGRPSGPERGLARACSPLGGSGAPPRVDEARDLADHAARAPGTRTAGVTTPAVFVAGSLPHP